VFIRGEIREMCVSALLVALLAVVPVVAAFDLGPSDLGPWTLDLGPKEPPTQPVNINTASAAELQKLPGIGPATARSIVRYRERNGPFRRVEELLIVRGISRSRLKALRPYITVEASKLR
jgi:competence ComEA-like helix-hairpin-helix protein